MSEQFNQALEQGKQEYQQLYNREMRFVKKTEDRISACNMVMMRARDIERELNGDDKGPDTFNLSMYDFEENHWKGCPCCGSPEINQKSAAGSDYLGCKKCGVLLNLGQIKLMRKPRK